MFRKSIPIKNRESSCRDNVPQGEVALLYFMVLSNWKYQKILPSAEILAKRLIKKIKFKKCKILADKGYPDYDFIDLMKMKQNNFISPPKEYGGKGRHNNFKRERKIRTFESNKLIYQRRVIVESVFSSLKRKQQLKLRSRLGYMKKREIGWHILFYNIRRSIVFDEKDCPKNLTFYFFKIEIWVTPDKVQTEQNLKRYILCIYYYILRTNTKNSN